MFSLRRLTDLIYGKPESLTLNRKIYITVTFALLLATLVGNILNLSIDLSREVIIITCIAFAVSIIFYMIARNSKHYKKTIPIAIIISVIFVTTYWLTNGGYNGPTPFILILIFLGLYVVVKPSQRGAIFIIAIALQISLTIFQNYLPHIVEPYISTKQRYNDILYSVVIYVAFIYAIIEIVLKSYLSENKKLDQKNNDLKLITQKIKQSEYRFKSIANQSPDVIFLTDLKGEINYISSACKKVFGYAEDEMMGHPFTHFLKDTDIEKAYKEFSNAIENKADTSDLLLSIKKKDGCYSPVELKASIYVENNEIIGTIGTIRDITERLKIQEKINVFSKIVEQSPASILMANNNGTIEYTNNRFIKNEKVLPNEIMGKNIHAIKSVKKESDFYEVMIKTMNSNTIWKGEIYNKNEDGSYLWEMASIFPIKNNTGSTTHYIALKQDITERKILTEHLLEALEQAEESDRLKSAFLANMSHEIRTPLNGIIGFSALLNKDNLTQTKKEKYTKIINKNAASLLHIISDILDISKMESGQLEICKTTVDLNKMINELYIQYSEKSIENDKVKMMQQLFKEAIIIQTDEFRLRQVFINLLDNALKFTDKGSIVFGIDTCDAQKVSFFVKDTGIGIAKKHHPYIFDRFRQAENKEYTPSGNGLGLAIVKQIIELMGGKIKLESDLKIGTIFSFWLPRN